MFTNYKQNAFILCSETTSMTSNSSISGPKCFHGIFTDFISVLVCHHSVNQQNCQHYPTHRVKIKGANLKILLI